MADEHFFPGPGDFSYSGGLGAVPFFGSSYAPPPPPPAGLDDVAAAFGATRMLPAWADLQLPAAADSSATTAHFDSTLSSLVSSPAHNGGGGFYGAGGVVGDDVAIGDLIGRLGSICSSAAASANNSCYSTPLSSPPRAAFWGGGYHGAPETGGGRLSRVASSKSLGAGATTPAREMSSELETSPVATTMVGGKPEETPEPAPAAKGAARKRKASGKGKGASPATAAAAAANNGSPKRSKVGTDKGKDGETGDCAAAAAEEEEEKPAPAPAPEPAKDYIHVRARRGQATDSHSLAERVRRERISERMKMLQSLVPACNKVTGKALMLDEIINYVQSLQRQVEFLSMKLATMSPELELELDAQYPPPPPTKDVMHQQAAAMRQLAAGYQAFSGPYAGSDGPFSAAAAAPGSTIHHLPGGGAGLSCWDWVQQQQQQDLQSVVQQQGNGVGIANHIHMKTELP